MGTRGWAHPASSSLNFFSPHLGLMTRKILHWAPKDEASDLFAWTLGYHSTGSHWHCELPPCLTQLLSCCLQHRKLLCRELNGAGPCVWFPGSKPPGELKIPQLTIPFQHKTWWWCHKGIIQLQIKPRKVRNQKKIISKRSQTEQTASQDHKIWIQAWTSSPKMQRSLCYLQLWWLALRCLQALWCDTHRVYNFCLHWLHTESSFWP